MISKLIINTTTPFNFTVVVKDKDGKFYEVDNDDPITPFEEKVDEEIPTDPDFDPTRDVS